MSDTEARPMETDSPRDESGDRILVAVNYVLCFLAIANVITALIAAILAYVRKDQAQPWLQSHFEYQIATVLYGLGFLVVGALTTWVLGLGFLIWIAGGVWIVIRSVVGLVRVVDGRPQVNPRGFGI